MKKIRIRKLNKDKDAQLVAPGASMTAASLYAGLSLRAAVMFLGMFGLTYFICDAFDIFHPTKVFRGNYADPGAVAVLCLLFCAAAVLSCINRITAAAAPVGFLGLAALYIAVFFGNPVTFAENAGRAFYNQCIQRLVDDGFVSMSSYFADASYSFDYNAVLTAGAALFAVLLGVILYFILFRRFLTIPVVLLALAVFVPVFTYNIPQSNTGFAFSAAFLCGAFALKIYDYLYLGRRDKKSARKTRRQALKQSRRAVRLEKKQRRRDVRGTAKKIYKTAIAAGIAKREARSAYLSVIGNEKKRLKNEKKNAKKQLSEQKKLKKAEKAAKRAQRLAEKNKKRSPEEKKRAALEKKERLEKRREQRKTLSLEHKKRVAAGGFAGIAAAAVACLAVLIPTVGAKEDFPIIEPINNRIQLARAYVTAWLYGDDVDLNDQGVYSDDSGMYSRTLSFGQIMFDEVQIFKVETSSDRPVYMRSWVGDTYNSSDNTWYSADSTAVRDFSGIFGDGYTPDSIATSFYSYVYPGSAVISEYDVSYNYKKYGFTVQQVNVFRLGGGADLMYIPTYMNTDLGVMAYGSTGKPDYRLKSYYDGVFTSRYYVAGTGYSTSSFIINMKRADAGANVMNSIEYYKLSADYISRSKEPDADISALYAEYENEIKKRSLTYVGTTLFLRYLEMTAEQKSDFDEAVKAEQKYASYAAEKYTSVSDDERIAALANEIFSAAEAQNPEMTDHDYIMAVIEYLRENYQYNLAPLTHGTKYEDILGAFLFEEKEGYCSHFATAAAMLLRERGYAVRYCEGYLAQNFEKNFRRNSVAAYRSDIFDSSAHAWIEVYFDGAGWIQYEATPEYYDLMYSVPGSAVEDEPGEGESFTAENIEQKPDITPPPIEEEIIPETNTPPEPVSSGDETELDPVLVRYIKLGITIVSAALLALAIWLIRKLIIRRAERAAEKRLRIIDRAKNREVYENKNTDRHYFAKTLCDMLFGVWEAVGLAPYRGELMTEFGQRLDREYPDLSKNSAERVAEIILREEYGGGLSYEEMFILADYLEDLLATVNERLPKRQKLYLRYVKCAI